MKKLKIRSKYILKIFISVLALLFFSKIAVSNVPDIEIRGNIFTDKNVILSLLDKKPEEISVEYSNYVIKTLNKSNKFENVTVNIVDNKYIITIFEYPNINKLYFDNNERLDDEELKIIANELQLINLNPLIINNYILEVVKIYESFGYGNVEISYYDNKNTETNTTDLTFVIDEGKITKINKINFIGNNSIDTEVLRDSIKSKTKNLLNIFANNNFKKIAIENDARILSNLYKNYGYINVNIEYKIEYLKNNRVNVYFEITEGNIYKFSSIKISDDDNIIDNTTEKNIEKLITESFKKNDNFSIELIDRLEQKITSEVLDKNIEFFEISSFQSINDTNIDILFEIKSIEPKYANQINIFGNSRTYDNVIRRELNISEGDPVFKNQTQIISKKLKSLNLFETVEVTQKETDNNMVNINIKVKEKQTGTVNAGVSVGTLDGFSVLAGLSERNFYGTGRSLNALVNTSEDKTELTFETSNRSSYINDLNLSYKVNYKEQDFSRVASYNLNSFSSGIGVSYKLNKKIRHAIDLEYLIKDYKVTNIDKVDNSIAKSSGENVSFLLTNYLNYSTLNSYFMPKNGIQISFNNLLETPTSSYNGYIKNILTYKNYKKINRNIFSVQSQIGNIFSLNSNDILTDDKFALGGKWLRGFDNYGAGPRNSPSSYIGGNNIIVSKLDYSREITKDSNFPFYINIFNDYGLLWDNKTDPTFSDNNLRSSAGFGIRYYSPIGPIGFSWGFPILDEEYDIKRMFLFSVGSID